MGGNGTAIFRMPFLLCPIEYWEKVRTTNAIERAFREVHRRIQPMTCFENTPSVDRITYGVIMHLNPNAGRLSTHST